MKFTSNIKTNKPNKIVFFKKYKNENMIKYWDQYLKLDVKYTNARRHLHYFNDIAYTPWPFHISYCVFLFLFFSVLYLHHFAWAAELALFSFSLILVPAYFWILELHYDSVYLGKFNFKVRRAIVGGFLLFLISEICVFSGFIWAYFDRYFHTPAQMGGTLAPLGIELVAWNAYPLWGCFVLLASGWGCNQAYYSARGGSSTMFFAWSVYGIALGILFVLYIQLSEYISNNTLSISDSVVGSCYYLITGFHGLHVCIGLVFLALATYQIDTYTLDRDRILVYALALTYWHFVDWIWLFVYTFLYVINGNIMYTNDRLIYTYWK